jgi:hypothetical protein
LQNQSSGRKFYKLPAATPELTRKGIARSFWTAVAVLLVYLVGIFARWQAGALLVIHNRSGQALRNVAVKVEYAGRRYQLGNLSPGKRWRVFAEPWGESHINLEFTDAENHPHAVTVIGYVEQGEPYCARGEATVLASGEVESNDHTTIGPCWRSWLDFVF